MSGGLQRMLSLTQHATRNTRPELVEGQHVSRFTFYASLLLAALLVLAWAPDPQADSVTITGQVVNGTAGGAVPADLPVTLHAFAGMEAVDVYTTTLSADGTFVFDGLSLGEETLVARTTYQGVTYTSAFTSLEAGAPETSLPITIFEATEDPADVSILQLHLFIEQQEDRLRFEAYCWYGNAGDRAYIGQQAASAEERTTTAAFTLPEGTENVSFDSASLGGRLVERENGFADTRPILPGEEMGETPDLLVTYELAYQEGLELQHTFDLPVRRIVLVLPQGGMTVEGAGITAQEAQMGAALYVAGPLAADEPLTFNVVPASAGEERAGAGQGSRGAEEQRDGGTIGLAFGLAALAAAAVVIYLMWQTPAAGAVPAQVRPQVEAIAALDVDFEAGQLSEKAYREKRRSLKREVRELLADLSG